MCRSDLFKKVCEQQSGAEGEPDAVAKLLRFGAVSEGDGVGGSTEPSTTPGTAKDASASWGRQGRR
jgi:hypothetical protein